MHGAGRCAWVISTRGTYPLTSLRPHQQALLQQVRVEWRELSSVKCTHARYFIRTFA